MRHVPRDFGLFGLILNSAEFQSSESDSDSDSPTLVGRVLLLFTDVKFQLI